MLLPLDNSEFLASDGAHESSDFDRLRNPGIDTLSKSDTIVPFGLGCWLCSSNTLAPLLDVVRSKRGVLVFQPRVVFLTPEDEETWLPFPKSSLQNAEP